jgi:hypothetical protein
VPHLPPIRLDQLYRLHIPYVAVFLAIVVLFIVAGFRGASRE